MRKQKRAQASAVTLTCSCVPYVPHTDQTALPLQVTEAVWTQRGRRLSTDPLLIPTLVGSLPCFHVPDCMFAEPDRRSLCVERAECLTECEHTGSSLAWAWAWCGINRQEARQSGAWQLPDTAHLEELPVCSWQCRLAVSTVSGHPNVSCSFVSVCVFLISKWTVRHKAITVAEFTVKPTLFLYHVIC